MNINTYLYEFIEDYKHAASEQARDDLFEAFCSSVWSGGNKRRVYTKTIRFTVKKDLLATDVGRIFDVWSRIEYTGYQSTSKNTDWYSLIRQKINNLYTRYFDKEVILQKDYLDWLNTPKRLYYQWIDGMEMNPDELTVTIHNAIDHAKTAKATYQRQKMDLLWKDYKKVIEGFLRKILNNCKLIEDYEDKSKLRNLYDFINEDNFYISYFCRYLENEMKQWQKKYYRVRNHQKYKRCTLCGRLIEDSGRNIRYCETCRIERRLETKRNWWKNKASC